MGLNDPLAPTIEDAMAEGERRFVSIGANAFGQLRVVVYTLRGDKRTNHFRAQTRTERDPRL